MTIAGELKPAARPQLFLKKLSFVDNTLSRSELGKSTIREAIVDKTLSRSISNLFFH